MGLINGGIPRAQSVPLTSGRAVPTFNPTVGANFRAIPTFNPQSGNAQAAVFEGLASSLNGIVDFVNNRLDKEVSQEAFQAGRSAGAQAGFDPNLLPEGNTLAFEQFREGAVKSFGAKLELEREQKFFEYQKQANGDPVVLAELMNGYINETASHLPENLRVPYVELSNAKAQPLFQRAESNFYAAQKKAHDADLDALFKLKQGDLLDNALPQTPEEQKAFAVKVSELKSVIDSMDKTPYEKQLLQGQFVSALTASATIKEFQAKPYETSAADNQYAYYETFLHTPAKELGFVGDDEATADEQKTKVANIMEAHLKDNDYASKQQQATLTLGQEISFESTKRSVESDAEFGRTSYGNIVSFAEENNLSADWVLDQKEKLDSFQIKQDQKNGKMMAFVNASRDGQKIYGATQDDVDGVFDLMTNHIEPSGQDFIKPVKGGVTSSFGMREHPVTGGKKFHRGVDYKGAIGDPVVAAKSGSVIKVAQDELNGKHIIVDHGRGVTSIYAHLNEANVSVGDKVSQGFRIGAIGQTGRVTGPHLHFGVYQNGEPVDPDELAKGEVAATELTVQNIAELTGRIINVYDKVPSQVMGKLRHWSRNGSDEEKIKVAEVIDFIVDTNPQLQDEFSDDELMFANKVRQKKELGYTDLQAVEQASFEIDPVNRQSQALLEEQVKKISEKPVFDFESAFDKKELPLGLQRTQMKSAWDASVREAVRVANGDEKAAVQIALKRMNKKWAKNSVNGRYQLYPPERFYSIGGNDDWIYKQLVADVNSAVFLSEPVGKEKVLLIPDSQTEREIQAGKPSYMVGYISPSTGEIMYLPGQRFVPDAQRELKKREKNSLKAAELKRKMGSNHRVEARPFNLIGK